MSTRLTSARPGCNWETSGGQSHVGRKARTGEAVVAPEGQLKMRMARARLPKLQSWDMTSMAANQRPKRCPASGRALVVKAQSSQPKRPASHPEDKGRTECLTASYLLLCVTAGSPKLVSMTPVWRRSRHSNRMPGVTPGTAAMMRTGMGISNRATDGESPAGRVKGGSACGINHRKQWEC
jgi:hypothetical protein